MMYKFIYSSTLRVVKHTTVCKINTLREINIISDCFKSCNVYRMQLRTFATSENYWLNYIFSDEKLRTALEGFISPGNKINSYEDRCCIKISKFFDIELHDAKKIVNLYSTLFLEQIDDTLEKCKIISETHLTLNVIYNNLWLLELPLPYINTCLKEMDNWGVADKRDEMVKLIRLPKNQFNSFSRRCVRDKSIIPEKNFVIYLSNMLQCPVEDVVHILLKNRILLLRGYELVDGTLRLLLENGISRSAIKIDSWVLNYTRKILEPRMKMLVNSGIPEIKPWMLRCKESGLETFVMWKRKQDFILSPGQSKEEYLASRLNVDVQIVKYIGEKVPVFYGASVPKLEEMIDFLHSEGFTSQDILATPRVMCHSIDTMRRRISQMQDLGYKATLPKLCCSSKVFRKTISNLHPMKASSGAKGNFDKTRNKRA